MLFQYSRDVKKERKKGAQKKGGENSPVSPPLDPRLQCIPKFVLLFVYSRMLMVVNKWWVS